MKWEIGGNMYKTKNWRYQNLEMGESTKGNG